MRVTWTRQGDLAQLGQVQPVADGSRIEMLMAQNAFGSPTVLVNGQDVGETDICAHADIKV